MSEFVTEPARETPVLMSVDVAVVGGGPAGIAASVSAARAGASTVLIERYGCLGGLITLSSMECPSWWREEGTTMPGGVVEDLDQKMIAMDAVQRVFFRPGTGLAYDTEVFKYVADEFIKENGVVPLLHCFGVAPLMDGNTIVGVITESKSGRMAILAKRVIDCTGDADIAARAGAEYAMADEPTGYLKPGEFHGATLVYGLTDVDVDVVEAEADADPLVRHPIPHKKLHYGIDAAREAGETIPVHTDKNFLYNCISRNELTALNHCWVRNVNGTDVRSITDAEIASRKSIMETIPILRKYEKGFANARLRNFAMTIGIRETRRIVGMYKLTLQDVFGQARFPDSIGVYPVCLDGPEGTMPAFTPDCFQVPYRIVVPVATENLLVAGRCVSTTRRAYSVARHINFAMVTGQGAGAAAALSIRQGAAPRDLEYNALKAELVKQRVKVDI